MGNIVALRTGGGSPDGPEGKRAAELLADLKVPYADCFAATVDSQRNAHLVRLE